MPWAYFYAASKNPPPWSSNSPSKDKNNNDQTISTGVWSDDPEFGKSAPPPR
jgi:hypothetical protein